MNSPEDTISISRADAESLIGCVATVISESEICDPGTPEHDAQFADELALISRVQKALDAFTALILTCPICQEGLSLLNGEVEGPRLYGEKDGRTTLTTHNSKCPTWKEAAKTVLLFEVPE